MNDARMPNNSEFDISNSFTLTPEQVSDVEETDFDYSGYQVVRGEFFSHINEPSITFNNAKINVNAACVNKLPDAEFVQILVNPTEKKLAIRPCGEDEKDSFLWSSHSKAGKKKPKQITCHVFFAKIIELMDWNPDYRYKVLGKLIHAADEYLFLFDLKTPEIFERIIKDGQKPHICRTPVYPLEWKNQFGLSVAEHRKALQVDIVDGFAVFQIKGPSSQRESPNTVDAESEVESSQ